jgi:hypothetical protein
MKDDHVDRRFAAILVTGIVGYSRMGTDEADNLMGDEALVQFDSVVDAVNCARKIPAGDMPEDAHRAGCGWSETYRFTIPDKWISGVYVVTAVPKGEEKGRWPAEHLFCGAAAQILDAIMRGDTKDARRHPYWITQGRSSWLNHQPAH